MELYLFIYFSKMFCLYVSFMMSLSCLAEVVLFCKKVWHNKHELQPTPF